ncbi:hypothetical protein MRX96_006094 [Rhipicephalus microplus]
MLYNEAKERMARHGVLQSDKHAPSGSELATSKTCCLDDLESIEACCPVEAVKESIHLLFIEPTAKVQQATTLVQKVLLSHHCLTTLDIDTDSFKGSETHFCDALRGNCSIRFLKLNISTFALRKDIYSAITCLPNLKAVDCLTDCECPVEFSAALAKVLRTSTKLTTLRIPKLNMNTASTTIFLPALVNNCTLTELSLHSSVISEALPEHRSSFAKFLANSKVLSKLVVGASNEVRQLSLKWVLEGLLKNTTLSEVTFDDFVVDPDSAVMMTKVLTFNHALRVLKIPTLVYDAWLSRVEDSTASCQTDFSAWISALVENKTLETVMLPLRIWETEQWEELLLGLSSRARSFKLTIKGHFSKRYQWEKLCRTLRSTGMEERVSFDTTLYILDEHEMLECKAFSKFHSFPCQDDHGEVSRMFRRLTSFTHVTAAHLEICIPDVNKNIQLRI